jgi:type I restriction enzyme S subunit
MSSVVPDGWNEPRVRDLFTLNTKSVVPNDSPQEKFTYFSLPAYDEFGTSIEVYGSEIESNKFEINDTSVLVSKLNPRKPRVMYAKPEKLRACASTEFMSFVPIESNGVSLNYFTHYFFSELFQKRLELVATGSTNSHVRVSPKETTNWRIAVPPLPEQKKIASILTSVDEVIENTQKQIDKLQDLKKATMNELLTKGIGHTEFKDSELGRIPKSWEVTTLGKLARFDSGYAFKNRELAEEGIKIVRISNLHKPNFPYWHFASEYKSTWVVEKGDVLFSWAGVANSINIHRYQGERALINQHIYNFKFESEALKEWTFQVMKYLLPKLKESIEGGAGQLHLTKPFIQAIGIVLPTQSERLRILELSSSLDKQINTVERKLSQTQSLKKSLMQDLLTGKVRVTVN